MVSRKKYIYFGHHKCATDYIRKIIYGICAVLNMSEKTELLQENLPYNYHLISKIDFRKKRERIHLHGKANNLKERIKYYTHKFLKIFQIEVFRFHFDFICFANADYSLVKKLDGIPFVGFHVIRDPRDITISGFFSHKYSHKVNESVNPWMVKQRNLLKDRDISEGIYLEFDYLENHFHSMRNWNYSNPNIYETKFEVLVQRPYEEFSKIFNFLGLTVPEEMLKGFLDKHSIERKKKRRGKDEDVYSHYRKGVSGEWRQYYTEEHKKKFKERFGELLIKTGYEKNYDW